MQNFSVHLDMLYLYTNVFSLAVRHSEYLNIVLSERQWTYIYVLINIFMF